MPFKDRVLSLSALKGRIGCRADTELTHTHCVVQVHGDAAHASASPRFTSFQTGWDRLGARGSQWRALNPK